MLKLRNLTEMEQIVDSELKISKKLKRFFNEYELSLLFDVQDVELGIAELKELTNEYDDIHSKLIPTSTDASDSVYKDTYQEQYDDQMSEIEKWIKQAKRDIKAKKENQLSLSLQEKLDEASKQKDQIRAEEKYLRGRIESEIQALYTDNSVFIEDLENGVACAQKLDVEYSQVFIEIEAYDQIFVQEFGTLFDDTSSMIKAYVKDTRQKNSGD